MTDPITNTETKTPPEPSPLPLKDMDILSWLNKAMQDPFFGSSFYNNLEKLGEGDRSLTEIKTRAGLGPLKTANDLHLEITRLKDSHQVHLLGNGKAGLAMKLGKKSLSLLDSLAFVGLGGGLELEFKNQDLLNPKSWENFKKRITAFHWDESLAGSLSTKLKIFFPKLPLSAEIQAKGSSHIDLKENKFISKVLFSGTLLDSHPAGLILENEFDLPKDFDFEKLKNHPISEITKLLQGLEKSQKTFVKIFQEKETQNRKEIHTYTFKKTLNKTSRDKILKDFLTGDFEKAFQTALSSEFIEKKDVQKYRVFEKKKTIQKGYPDFLGLQMEYKQIIEDLNENHGPFHFDNRSNNTP